jgi:hypothetical protein
MGTVLIVVVGNVIATLNIDEDCLWKSSVRN